MTPLHIAVSCGGTGGHTFPGLATARELQRRGHTVTLWLAGRGIEGASTRGWDGPIVTIPGQGLTGGFSLRTVAATWQLARGLAHAVRNLQAHRPHALLAMGSYASVAPVLAARLLRIPVVLHEANLIPGRAVLFLSRCARAIGIHFDGTRAYLHHPNLVVTGMPLREEMKAIPLSDHNPNRPFTVLIMGGSQGARQLNEVGAAAVIALHRAGLPLQAIHLAGPKDEARVRQAYAGSGIAVEVHGFLHAIQTAYAAADVAVSRAGASSCAELAVCGLPALLVPYPLAARDHQRANARAMAKAGAADWIDQSQLDVPWLSDYLRALAGDCARRDRMRLESGRLAVRDGAARLADLVERVRTSPP